MNLPLPQDRRRRAGFTLVELIVVLGIILILMSLLIVGVSKALGLGKRTQVTNDLSQLTASFTNFQQNYNVSGIPSVIHLSETCRYNSSDQLDVDSVIFLQKMFPKASFAPGTWYDWNGDNVKQDSGTTPGAGEYYLEGDQCLVFFLGGIPSIDPTTGVLGTTGFSTNPSDPTFHIKNPSNPGQVKGPFYEFKSERLTQFPHVLQQTKSPAGSTPFVFFSYTDSYGRPFAYFSSYGCYGPRNGYNRYYSQLKSYGVSPPSDCATLQLYPYAQGTQPGLAMPTTLLVYLNPTSGQIISAGEDKIFGVGTDPTNALTFWTPQTAEQSLASSGNGADDLSNFYGHKLGDTP